MTILESIVRVDEFIINDYLKENLSQEDYYTFNTEDLYEEVLDYIDRIYQTRTIQRHDFINSIISICLDNSIIFLG